MLAASKPDPYPVRVSVMARRTIRRAAVGLAALVLVGCGSSAAGSTTTSSPTTTEASTTSEAGSIGAGSTTSDPADTTVTTVGSVDRLPTLRRQEWADRPPARPTRRHRRCVRGRADRSHRPQCHDRDRSRRSALTWGDPPGRRTVRDGRSDRRCDRRDPQEGRGTGSGARPTARDVTSQDPRGGGSGRRGTGWGAAPSASGRRHR